jgi:hypothetical protein
MVENLRNINGVVYLSIGQIGGYPHLHDLHFNRGSDTGKQAAAIASVNSVDL